jgi:carbamoyltransferase
MPQNNPYLCVHIGHNASAAIIKNGVIKAAAEEERFSRRKNETGFPENAVAFCLAQAGVEKGSLSGAAYTSVHHTPLEIKSRPSANFSLRDYHEYHNERFYARKFRGEDVLDYYQWLRDDPQFNKTAPDFDYSFLSDEGLKDYSKVEKPWRQERARRLAEACGLKTEQIDFIDHHTCHAYYSYFASPLRNQDAIVLVLDGMGDGRNQTVWRATENNLALIAESTQNDIGRLYRMVTLLLGMRPLEHEYKVMGLAPYAKTSYVKKCLDKFRNISRVDGMRIVEDQRPQDLYNHLRSLLLDERFDNIGGAAQTFSEELATEVVSNIHKECGVSNFILGGGIAMNVKMNQRIAALDCVEALYVPGSAADESLSIGGCYYLNHKNGGGDAAPLQNMYLGFDASDDVENADWDALSQKFLVRRDISNHDVAVLLRKGDIVARINERCEFGQRSLGNRSILADPSRKDTVMRINEAVKNRDFWMPFALSLLEEQADQYIDNPKGLPAKFMTLAFDTKAENYNDIVAGTHPYDRTVRPQIASKNDVPSFHALISAFYDVSGIPALLNTSFNLHGEPIVNTLSDALRTFEASGIDHLLAGNVLLSKKGA